MVMRFTIISIIPDRGTGMSQAFLFPHSNPSGGLFALHDPRSSLPPGLGDFSPSLVGDINTVSSIGGAASLNNMFSPVTSGATTPGRLPTGLPVSALVIINLAQPHLEGCLQSCQL